MFSSIKIQVVVVPLPPAKLPQIAASCRNYQREKHLVLLLLLIISCSLLNYFKPVWKQ